MTKVPKTRAAAEDTAAEKAKGRTPPEGTKVEKPEASDKPNALQQPLQPSPDLAAIIGDGKMAR